jgi:hypothetical protein
MFTKYNFSKIFIKKFGGYKNIFINFVLYFKNKKKIHKKK